MRAFRWPLGVVLGQDRRAGQHRKRRGEPLLAVDDQQPRRRLFRIRPDLPGTYLRAGVPEQQVAENSVTEIGGEPPQPEPCASPDQRPGACRGGYQRRGRRCQTQAPYPSEAVAVSGDDGYLFLAGMSAELARPRLSGLMPPPPRRWRRLPARCHGRSRPRCHRAPSSGGSLHGSPRR
jgi:hypothetical protein